MAFSFSILPTQTGFLKALLFTFTMLLVCRPALSMPTDITTLDSSKNNERYVEKREPFTQPIGSDMVASTDLAKRAAAGLAWGPVYIGNLKLTLTNPHDGYAGPKFPNANHVNFHVDKKTPNLLNRYNTPVVNLHIVKYTRGASDCLYAWDSVTGKTVYDQCSDNFSNAAASAVAAIKSFVDTLLVNADAIAAVAVIAALGVALIAVLAGSAAVVLA